MKLGFNKILFYRKIPKCPFLSNLFNKKIQSQIKVEESKLDYLIDKKKNQYLFERKYSIFNKSNIKLPLIYNNNLNKSDRIKYNKENSPIFSYRKQHNKKLNKSVSLSSYKSINFDILSNIRNLFNIEEKIINNRKKKTFKLTNPEITNIILYN